MPSHEGAVPGKVFVWSSGDLRSMPEKPAARRSHRKAVIPPAIETRRYPRVDLRLSLQYRVLRGGPADIPSTVRPFLLAQSRDVTPLGMCLALSTALSIDSVLSLQVHGADGREKFEALGRVVWCRPAADGLLHLVGVQFVVVDGARVVGERHARVGSFLEGMDA